MPSIPIPLDSDTLILYLDQIVFNSPYSKLILAFIFCLIFVFLISMVRRHVFQLSFKGAVFGFVLGVIIMLILDAIVIFGVSDKEKLKQLFTEKNKKGAAEEIISEGVSNMNKVLGTSMNASSKKTYTREDILEGLISLPDDDLVKVRDLICPN